MTAALAVYQAALVAILQLEGFILDNKTICVIESGKRIVTDYELVAIAKVINVDVDWLLGIDIKKTPT